MERIKLDYEPLRAAVARGNRTRIEAEARKLRDHQIAHLVTRAVTDIRSSITALGRSIHAWYEYHDQVAPMQRGF